MQTRRALKFSIGCLALTTALAACTAGSPVVMERSYVSPNYKRSLISAATRYDGVKLDVIGAPLGASQEAVNEIVAREIHKVNELRNINFTTGEPDLASPYRMVVLFDPAVTATYRRVCRGKAEQREPFEAGVSLMLTFCLNKKAITSLRAYQSGIEMIADKKFADLVRNTAASAFNPRHEIRGNGDGDDNKFP